MTASKKDQEKSSSDRPSWLIHIEERIEEERDEFPLECPYYEIVRDLLLVPKEDNNAVSQAIHKFYDVYTTEAENEIRRRPEYSAGHKLNTIASVTFETADEIFYTTYQHDRLAELLIGIKREAANEYNIENPKFVYYSWGVENAANESWNAGHVDALTQRFATEPKEIWAEAWINTSALLAKLFQGGLLDADGARWIADDFERAFESDIPGDVRSDIGRQAQILALVNYIIIAGEIFVKKVRRPSQTWKLWASKIKGVADTVDKDTRWDLKGRAQMAYDRMVELYPEAFDER
ncbi:hypothetical protein FHETE_3617 [Fusarium heterosporum]|uniref:Uncharacterized protein n=1 Tax=Fusarium heterosporum TaxID=42747 RepID=A0A8H5WWG3_FUSHE|nr:hypothetical protein FHETE_3617 [Fusarium heterosporum]